MRTRLAVAAGGAVAGLSRRLGRGGGSVVGGRATLALDPQALRRLAPGYVIALVSGTNGKTTTTSLLRAGLATTGPVVTNLLGANLLPGLTAALAAAHLDRHPPGRRSGRETVRNPYGFAPTSPPGAAAGPLAVLEVDEAWLGRAVDATAPAVVVLLNLSRDQLDRNNEVRRLAASWRATFAGRGATTIVANADDPLVAWGAGAASDVVWVGAGQPWTADAAGCPNCGSRIRFSGDFAPGRSAQEAKEVGGEGWACTSCEFRRPALSVRVGDHQVSGGGWRAPLHIALPGRCNRANAALALTAAVALGAQPDAAARAMAATAEVVGRYATLDASGVDARLLLAKNPAGWLEIFDILRPPPVALVVGINARIADGRDPSWLWDVPFEQLGGRRVVATGERSRDLAVRLHYAEVDHVRVDDPVEALRVAGRSAPSEPGRPQVDVVANYTAFQQLRARLGAGSPAAGAPPRPGTGRQRR